MHFGEPVFKQERPAPANLTVLRGEAYEKTLATLVEEQVFKPSPAVLTRRIRDLQTLYDTAMRASQGTIIEHNTEYKHILAELKIAEEVLKKTRNAQISRGYVAKLPAQLIEFMVCPEQDDPVLHALLPLLSWNSHLRSYHRTASFIKRFTEGDDNARARMLHETAANIFFNYQQNNDVNVWLYTAHQAFCEQQGISFKSAN